MKKVVVAAVIALSAVAARAEFLSANDLLSKMNSSSAVDNGVALGYVMGIFDVMSGVSVCAPESVTAGQVSDMAKKFIIAMPEKRHLSADQFVSFLLKNTWPCKRSGSNGAVAPTPEPGIRRL